MRGFSGPVLAGPARRLVVAEERFVVDLVLPPGGGVAGSIRVARSRREWAFSGWMGLIEVLEMLCRRLEEPGRGGSPR